LLGPFSPLRFAINLTLLVFLTRLLPTPGRVPIEQDYLVVQVPFSEFMRRLERDHVQDVEIDGPYHTFSLRPRAPTSQNVIKAAGGKTSKPKRISYMTTRPSDMPTPYETMVRNNVQFGAPDKRGNRFFTVVLYAFYFGLALAALNRLPVRLSGSNNMRRGARGTLSKQNIKFDDVAGVDEAKEELQEIVEYLKDPEKFTKLGAKPPSGVLLVGAPGTGKTLLAKAVAGEASAPFFSIAASEFVELYVGMGASRVRDLFAKARRESPSIVFIDEIDAVAKGRDSRLRSVGNDEREQTLNQLLTELDGFDSNKDSTVICMAATNRPDVLDSALLRPGRFDRRITVERPDRVGREQILQVHIDKQRLPLGENIDLGQIAAETIGFTGADLANIVNEAALLAGRQQEAVVDHRYFAEAIERNIAGIEKKRSILKGTEKHMVATHEAGHAVVATAISSLLGPAIASEVEKLSIVPRSSGALGFTYVPPTDDRALMFETELRGRLAMLMGGRAAEEVEGGIATTGAMDDIRQATDMAYKIVAEYGLSPTIGPLSVGTLATGADSSGYAWRDQGGGMGERVDREVKRMLDTALAVAKDTLNVNNKVLTELATTLEEEEKLQGEKLTQKLARVKIPPNLKLFVEQGLMPQNRDL